MPWIRTDTGARPDDGEKVAITWGDGTWRESRYRAPRPKSPERWGAEERRSYITPTAFLRITPPTET